jgi:MoaA/NifB/PqqE/SkfB family radical SAM enzyme
MSRVQTTCEIVAFCSSAGHCQLDCSYCVVVPVIKRQPSLTYEDLAFFLEAVGKRTFFIFSGKGDFFAGYPKRERLLDRLLDHDVEVALDVNGVLLNDYPDLSPDKLARIRSINLTMHYDQIVEKRVEKVWAENARILLDRHRGDLILGTILSPLTRGTWDEGLDFYRRAVFERTGQRVWLIKDADRPMSADEEAHVAELSRRHADMVDRTHRDDFAAAFTGPGAVLCPAGSTYFRIWNDGSVDGCPYVPELGGLGNLKQRRFSPRPSAFTCATARFCDCYDLRQLGRMREAATGDLLPALPA